MVQEDRQLAARIWPALVTLAAERRKVRYGQLGEQLGAHPYTGIPRGLAPIQDYCEANGLPPLTILVVSASSGRPGSGFYDHNRERDGEVFGFDWTSMHNPFA